MNKGFTLIEVIIYIALFSLLIGTAFLTAYQLMQGSDSLKNKNTVQDEGNFVLRKIDWALTGVQTTTTPSAGTPNSNILKLTKYNGNTITIDLSSAASPKIEMKESADGNTFLPITTDNVSVKASSLNFQYIPASGSGPYGITASFTLTKDGTDFPFSTTKYIRK